MPAPTNTMLRITNQERDTICFAPVFKTESGRPPAKDADKVESFRLELGSDDDKGVAEALQPEQDVPAWVVDALRKTTLFKTLETSRHIMVTHPA